MSELTFVCHEGNQFPHNFDETSDAVVFVRGMHHLSCKCHMVLFSWKPGERNKAIEKFKEYHGMEV